MTYRPGYGGAGQLASRPEFAQILADATIEARQRQHGAAGLLGDQVRSELAALLMLDRIAPSAGASCTYEGDNGHDLAACGAEVMLRAARVFEAALMSNSAMTAVELKRLRRAVAVVLHPDVQIGKDRELAGELMKRVNALVAAAIRETK